MIRILGIGQDDEVLDFYRMHRPFDLLPKDEFQTQTMTVAEPFPSVERVREFDVLYLTRWRDAKYLPFVREMSRHVRIVLDYDDMFNMSGHDRDVINEYCRFAHGLTGIVPELVNFYAGQIRTCAWHNGVDATDPLYQRPLEKPQGKKVIAIGTLMYDMESVRFINPVIQQILAEYPDVMIQFSSLPQCLELLPLPDDRRLTTGRLPLDEYLRIFSLADLVVVPYAYGEFPWGKGIPRLLQAAMWECPSIYSPIAAAKRFSRESAGRGVFIVRDNKPEAWLRQIREVLDDPARGREVGKQARETAVELYGETRQVGILVDFLRTLMRITSPGWK